MYPTSLETTHRLANLKAESYLKEAEALRLLRACPSEERQGWLRRQVCTSLCGLGRILVRAGQRLQRYEPRPAAVRSIQPF